MIYIDTETYSATPIGDGTYRYAANCEVMIVTWAVGDGPVQAWDRTLDRDMPFELIYALEHGGIFTAHSSMFDRNVLKHSLGIDIPIDCWRDTMVQAYLHGLPGGLDLLCDILRVPQDKAKIKDGKKLIHLFCKPQPFKFARKRADFPSAAAYRQAKAEAEAMWPGRATRETHPTEWARFIEYAVADIEAMREVHRRLPKWNYQENSRELALWHLDQKINDRGFFVDTNLAEKITAMLADEKVRLAGEANEATEGAVESTTQRDAVLNYAAEAFGLLLPDLQKATIQRRIDDPDTPPALRELFLNRLDAGSTSVSKYKTLLKSVGDDGRLRGTKQFAGAFRTGRWAGRTIQPDNLPRPTMSDGMLDACIDATLLDAGELVIPNITQFASSAVRKCIAAPSGRKLVIADLANIEGRALAYLAGEDWKLQAFRDYDAGTGPDLYKLAYAKAFAIPPDEVGKHERQIGKVMELMLGYAGGVGAFLTGATTYSIDLDDMADRAWSSIPDDVPEEAREFHSWSIEKKISTHGLHKDTFVACDSLKRMWRRAHPRTVMFWREVGVRVRAAIERPGQTQYVGSLKIRRDGAWLRVALPSGRAMVYPSPQSDDGKLSYMGTNQYTKKWERIGTYEGKLVENIVQAFARDILADSMPRAEAEGYEIVLHVHDELVTEVPDTPEYNVDRLSEILSVQPTWAEGLPLAAAGFEAYRYRKD